MNKKLIKQAVFIVVCAVLIISAALLSLDFNEVAAGAGKGTNAKIETIDSLSELVGGFNRQLSDFNAPSEEEIASLNYQSFTLYETSDADIEIKKQVEGKSSADTTRLKCSREMTVYVSENASYYEANCMITNVQETWDNSKTENYNEKALVKSCISLKMRLYIEETFIMLRFDEYDSAYFADIAEGGERTDGLASDVFKNILGKWLYVSTEEEYGEEVIDTLLGPAKNNLDVFNLIGEYLGKEFLFQQEGSVYELIEDYHKQFINDLLNTQFGTTREYFNKYSDKARFKVDLRNKTEPKMRLEMTLSEPWEITGQDNRLSDFVSCSGTEVDIFTFKNINNTVIKAPDKKNTLSFEEFYLLIEG